MGESSVRGSLSALVLLSKRSLNLSLMHLRGREFVSLADFNLSLNKSYPSACTITSRFSSLSFQHLFFLLVVLQRIFPLNFHILSLAVLPPIFSLQSLRCLFVGLAPSSAPALAAEAREPCLVTRRSAPPPLVVAEAAPLLV